MPVLYQCDQCEYTQPDPLSFRLEQITDETDDDGDPIIMVFYLCSAQCLSNLAMGLTLDFEGD